MPNPASPASPVSPAADDPAVTSGLLRTSLHEDLSLTQMMAVEATGEANTFVGQSNPYGMPGIYGGHFLGQALAAGFETVEEPKLAHSFHAYFLLPGDEAAPIAYTVTELRNGRGSDTRSIEAWQNERRVFQMLASFKLPEDGDEHQPSMPPVESPEVLRSARAGRGEEPFPFPPTMNGWCEMEWASQSFRDAPAGSDPELRLWSRLVDEGASEREVQISLAYLSDGPLVFTAILPHGRAMETHWATSIDHSAWFHRPVDASQWLLCDASSSAAAGGRGMNESRTFQQDGTLVMTCAQESILRRM